MPNYCYPVTGCRHATEHLKSYPVWRSAHATLNAQEVTEKLQRTIRAKHLDLFVSNYILSISAKNKETQIP